MLTTQDAIIVCPLLKMLAGDYLCYVNLAHDRGLDPHCRLWQALSSRPAPAEDLAHLLTRCRGTADTRNSVMPNLFNTITQHCPSNRLLLSPAHDLLTQFVLDCASLNLPTDIRIPPTHPGYASITRNCSLFINSIHKNRTRQLKAMGLLG